MTDLQRNKYFHIKSTQTWAKRRRWISVYLQHFTTFTFRDGGVENLSKTFNGHSFCGKKNISIQSSIFLLCQTICLEAIFNKGRESHLKWREKRSRLRLKQDGHRRKWIPDWIQEEDYIWAPCQKCFYACPVGRFAESFPVKDTKRQQNNLLS